jgi:hypothetical protein
VRLLTAPTPETAGSVLITEDGVEQPYLVVRIPADFGEGWKVVKVELTPTEPGSPPKAEVTATYHVNLNGQQSSCTCLGFLRHGMFRDGRGCKHIAALFALKASSRLN